MLRLSDLRVHHSLVTCPLYPPFICHLHLYPPNHLSFVTLSTTHWSLVPGEHQLLVTCPQCPQLIGPCPLFPPPTGHLSLVPINNQSLIPCVHYSFVTFPLCPPLIYNFSHCPPLIIYQSLGTFPLCLPHIVTLSSRKSQLHQTPPIGWESTMAPKRSGNGWPRELGEI